MHKGFWCESQNRSLGRPASKWEDNIKIDLGETGWGGTDWIYLVQD
jgi:hypothetical protein